jgi:hypothetical protein
MAAGKDFLNYIQSVTCYLIFFICITYRKP